MMRDTVQGVGNCAQGCKLSWWPPGGARCTVCIPSPLHQLERKNPWTEDRAKRKTGALYRKTFCASTSSAVGWTL